LPLRAIVRALGGDLYDGGRRANIPAPGHSRDDRSVSLLWSDGRIVIHSFGRADWREVRDLLDRMGLLACADVRASTARPRFSIAQRISAARRLWAEARPAIGSLAERHLRLRGIHRPIPDALRFHAAVSLAVYAGGRLTKPALVAAITAGSGPPLTAVEITYLDPSGQRAAGLKISRKTVGVIPPGSAVRLDQACAEMLVAEGVATTLSASERFGLPGWALLAVRNLRAWSPPATARRVLIAADRGGEGEAGADLLARRLKALGIEVGIALPPKAFGDWNDVAQGQGEGERGRV
jgi:hypothetical protein